MLPNDDEAIGGATGLVGVLSCDSTQKMRSCGVGLHLREEVEQQRRQDSMAIACCEFIISEQARASALGQQTAAQGEAPLWAIISAKISVKIFRLESKAEQGVQEGEGPGDGQVERVCKLSCCRRLHDGGLLGRRLLGQMDFEWREPRRSIRL